MQIAELCLPSLSPLAQHLPLVLHLLFGRQIRLLPSEHGIAGLLLFECGQQQICNAQLDALA